MAQRLCSAPACRGCGGGAVLVRSLGGVGRVAPPIHAVACILSSSCIEGLEPWRCRGRRSPTTASCHPRQWRRCMARQGTGQLLLTRCATASGGVVCGAICDHGRKEGEGKGGQTTNDNGSSAVCCAASQPGRQQGPADGEQPWQNVQHLRCHRLRGSSSGPWRGRAAATQRGESVIAGCPVARVLVWSYTMLFDVRGDHRQQCRSQPARRTRQMLRCTWT